MKKWWGKSVMAYVAEVLVGYGLLELLIYIIFPFWKAKSGDLALSVLVLTFASACSEKKRQFLLRTLFMAVLLMAPAFVGLLAKQPLPIAMQYRTIAFSLIFSGAFFFLQAMLPFRKIRIGISAVFYLIVFLLFLLPWGYFFASHSLLNASAVLAVFQTNPAEAKSYLVDFMPWQAWGIMAVLLAAYVFLLRQWRPSLLSMRTSLQNRWGILLIMFCIVLTAILYIIRVIVFINILPGSHSAACRPIGIFHFIGRQGRLPSKRICLASIKVILVSMCLSLANLKTGCICRFMVIIKRQHPGLIG